MKSARRILEPPALQLVEEAVHLLRGASAATLAVYYAGAVPFVLGLLFFWAHATWFAPSGEQLAWGALGLVALFLAMKAAQAEFCARLMAARLGAPLPAWSWARFGRLAVAQMRLQPWALLVSLPASLLTVPLGWVYAYAQNVVVIGEAERLHDDAVAQAKLWPGQNHLGLLVISLLSLGVWVNLGASFLAVPWLANKLLGIENIFGFSGWWFLNTTFVASVTALTWLAVDPLVKAFYVLRVFHGRARRTGDDVRVELQLARSASAALRVAAMIALLLMVPRANVRAGDAPPARTAVQPAQLDRAIDEVLAGPEFRWRLRPVPAKDAKNADGPVKRFIRQGIELIAEMFRSVGRTIGKVMDWISRYLRGSRAARDTATTAATAGTTLVTVLLYIFIAAAVVLILWVIWLIVRNTRRHGAPVIAAQAVTATAPDLRDENVQAAQLPVDGWLALAREQAGRGEWRLALRALYLATLARLAAEGLVSLAKFKTNLDYEREVRRRALSRTEIAARFAMRRREFEDVWYGSAQPGESAIRAWMAELERPATP
jgi:hypothetical protein